MTEGGGISPPDPLVRRYGVDDLAVFTDSERGRFVPAGEWPEVAPAVAWELLYRREPELYDRLVAGERLHPGILAWLPCSVGTCVEVGAGTGRLTADLAPRSDRLVAVEPAEGLRRILRERVPDADVVPGFFDALPFRDGVADLVCACSAFTTDDAHGGTPGLAEMERVARSGGLVVIVWPTDPGWLSARGYQHVVFGGDIAVEFDSVDEAVAVSRVFYPHAVDEIVRRGVRRVPYGLLGIPEPRDLCWKRV